MPNDFASLAPGEAVPTSYVHRNPQRPALIATAVSAALLAVITLVLTSDVEQRAKQYVTALSFIVATAAMTASWALAARRETGGMRTASRLMTAFGGVWVVASVGFLYFQVIAAPAPYPNLSDLCYLSAVPLGVAALLAFPGTERATGERVRFLLDAVVVAGSVLFVSTALALGRVFEFDMGAPLADAVFAAYPLSDIVLISLALLLVLRASPSSRLRLGLVAAGMLPYAIADTAFAAKVTDGTYAIGTPLDLGWMVGYALLTIAAWAPPRPDASLGRRAYTLGSVARSLIVYGPLGVALVVSAEQPLTLAEQPLLTITGAVIVGALSVRQVLLAVDNESLRRDLEAKVASRTAELNALAEQSKAILDSVGDGIYGMDANGVVTFVNPAARATLGYDTTELLGRHGHDVLHGTRADGSTYPWQECPVRESLSRGTTVQTSEEYIAADGTRLPIELTASPVVENGQITGAVVVFRDVTKRREVDRMKDEFISVVSHELRTPLTSIRGSLGLVSSGSLGELPPRAGRMVAVAAESTDRLTRLINDILDIERIKSVELPMERAVSDIADLVDAALRELQPMTTAAGVRVVSHVETAQVDCDADRIVQTIMNLVSNAVKFSARGDAVVVRAAVEGKDVVVSVADQGRGVPADKIDSIFGRFQQVDSSDSRQKGGTGLGLAICKGIVERHGGRIWAESTLGVGSVFRFTLPAVGRPQVRSAVDDAPAVLVCDDDRDLLDAVTVLLADAGLRAIVSDDASEAFRLAVHERPAAVLLDLNMPAPDGRDAFRNLLLHPETRDVPVVVLSCVPPEDEPDIAARAMSWVTKPADPATLLRVISAAVRKRPRPLVLVVEDDEPLVDVLAASLEGHGLVVTSAANASDAVALSKRLLPDVLLLDVTLLGSDGFDVVAALRADERLAEVPLVVYTGMDLDRAAKRRLTLGPTVFLTKARCTPGMVEEHVLRMIHRAEREEVHDDGEPTRAGR